MLLQETAAAPPLALTDKTAKRGLLSVLAVTPEGGAAETAPVALTVQARLLRWGWPAPEAKRVAARLAARDADDPRRTCTECSHYRPAAHRCAEHRRAGLQSPDVSRDLAELPQHCPGFKGGNQ
jgi:hypothetical protein